MESTTKQGHPPGRDVPHPAPIEWALQQARDNCLAEEEAIGAWLSDRRARTQAACAEIGREIAFRRAVYPRFVADGKLSQEKASRQVEALEDAAVLLRELLGMPR